MDQQRTQLQGLFDQMAPTYDHVGVEFFGPIAAGLVAELDPQPGEHVLDVGCGRGAVLSRVARTVGSTGSVLGIDFSPAMVEASLSVAEAAGLTHVDIRVMDAQDPDLPTAHFDVIASSLVLFFLPDPAAALRAWRGLLVDGGRIAVSTFGGYDTAWESVDAVFGPYLPPGMRDARTSGKQGPFATDEGVELLLSDAGFVDVRTVGGSVPVRFDSADHWHRWTMSTGQLLMWELVPDADRAAVQANAYASVEETRRHNADGRMGFDQEVRYTLGRR
jgi:SAM-dependent methyltransferase